MSTPQTHSYRKLLQVVQVTLTEGRLRAEQAVERERLTTYHEVGHQIHQHLTESGEGGTYGERLFLSLAGDLEIAEQLLRDAVNVYRWHPNFPRAWEIRMDPLPNPPSSSIQR